MTMNQEITLSEAGAVPYQSLQASYLLQCLVCTPYLLNVCRTHILYKTGVPDSSCHPSSASSPCLGDSLRNHPVKSSSSSPHSLPSTYFIFLTLLIYNLHFFLYQFTYLQYFLFLPLECRVRGTGETCFLFAISPQNCDRNMLASPQISAK